MRDEKTGEFCRCPRCLAKEVEVPLFFDEERDEYYCPRCCFVGAKKEVFRAYEELRRSGRRTPDRPSSETRRSSWRRE